MSNGAAKSTRRRYRLHKQQDGKCFYCPDEIGAMLRDKGNPVLEHYIPRAHGGTHTVLACCQCDKAKGMIHGPEFESIIRDVVAKIGAFNNVARQEIQRQCKARNNHLQQDHPARLAGGIATRERTERIKQQRSIVVADYSTIEVFIENFRAGKHPVDVTAESGVEDAHGK